MITTILLSCSILFANTSDGARIYEEKSVEEKLTYLYSQVQNTRYEVLPDRKAPFSEILKTLRTFVVDKLKLTFTHASDFLPKGRIKTVHTYGAVGRVEIRSLSNKYTGILSGAKGIARFSLAIPQQAGSFTPAIALKFPVAGGPSQQIFLMHSLDGQGENRNFFENILSNRIPEPTAFATKILARIFALVKKDANVLGVEDQSKVQQDGTIVQNPTAPFQLFAKPRDEVKYSPEDTSDFRIKLGEVPVGETLYDLYAKQTSTSRPELIGHLILTSDITASSFGDQVLFFQHPKK